MNERFMEQVVMAGGLVPERARGQVSRHTKSGYSSKLVWHIIHPSGQRYYCDTAPWSHDEPKRFPKTVAHLCDVCVDRANADKVDIDALVDETNKVLASRVQTRGRSERQR